jgi:Na+/H+ antiporter NhaA
MWLLIRKPRGHATIAGVFLAFAIPFSARQDDETSRAIHVHVAPLSTRHTSIETGVWKK